jgi:hypothetical protein
VFIWAFGHQLIRPARRRAVYCAQFKRKDWAPLKRRAWPNELKREESYSSNIYPRVRITDCVRVLECHRLLDGHPHRFARPTRMQGNAFERKSR